MRAARWVPFPRVSQRHRTAQESRLARQAVGSCRSRDLERAQSGGSVDERTRLEEAELAAPIMGGCCSDCPGVTRAGGGGRAAGGSLESSRLVRRLGGARGRPRVVGPRALPVAAADLVRVGVVLVGGLGGLCGHERQCRCQAKRQSRCVLVAAGRQAHRLQALRRSVRSRRDDRRASRASDRQGGEQRNNTQPAWSPDGASIVFRTNGANPSQNVADIWIMDLAVA